MSQSVEVEVTGPLTSADLARLASKLQSWCSEGAFDRYMINFTTDELRARQVDVRARVTNGDTEFIVKHGEWGSGKRSETIVRCQAGQFEALVHALVAVGFSKGIGCKRLIKRFRDGEVEFSIIEVPGYTTFFEAEIIAPKGTEDAAMDRLRAWCRELELRSFSKPEFLAFIDDLDAQANDVLDLSSSPAWAVVRGRISSDS